MAKTKQSSTWPQFQTTITNSLVPGMCLFWLQWDSVVCSMPRKPFNFVFLCKLTASIGNMCSKGTRWPTDVVWFPSQLQSRCSQWVCYDFMNICTSIRSFVVRAIKENIVGFLVICTLLVWVPISTLIYCVSIEHCYYQQCIIHSCCYCTPLVYFCLAWWKIVQRIFKASQDERQAKDWWNVK